MKIWVLATATASDRGKRPGLGSNGEFEQAIVSFSDPIAVSDETVAPARVGVRGRKVARSAC